MRESVIGCSIGLILLNQRNDHNLCVDLNCPEFRIQNVVCPCHPKTPDLNAIIGEFHSIGPSM